MKVTLEIAQLHCLVVATERVKFVVLELALLLLKEVRLAAHEMVQPVMIMNVVVAKEKAQL